MTSFFIILRESIEYSLIILLLAGIYREYATVLISSAILVIVTGIVMTAMAYPFTSLIENASRGFTIYSFVMILLLALVIGREVVYPIVCLVLALLLPSSQLAAVIISEVSLLEEHAFLFYVIAGVITGIVLFVIGLRLLARADLRKYFSPGSSMVAIAAFCFLFGGLHEFDEASVIASIQRGFHTFLASLIVFSKELLLIPHGGNITTSLDRTLEYLSSQRVAMAATALLLSVPPVYVFVRLLLTPEPETKEIAVKAERRKVLAIYTDELIRKGSPILLSLLVSIVMLHSANLAMNPSFDPEPIPVLAEGDMIEIPLAGKYGDISDGRIRKFSFRDQGHVYKMIVIMRPDGEVTAALDACEICPPDGYVQRGRYLVCKYCGTPIPLQSIGHPGGCNPIPVQFRIKGDTIIIVVNDIAFTHKKWIDPDSEKGRK